MKPTFIMIILLTLISCTRTIYMPVESVRHVTTTVVDTFVEVITPPERVVNVTTDTTSTISTQYATSTAEVSNGILQHQLTQHPRIDSLKTTTIHTHTVDSIPYPIEVTKEVTPAWCYGSILITILAVAISIILLVPRK